MEVRAVGPEPVGRPRGALNPQGGEEVSCECQGLEGLELLVCLAAPPGDYEVVLELGVGRSLVVNSNGVFIRASSRDDFLPFVRTQQTRVSKEVLAAFKVDLNELFCEIVRALRDAATHGSLAASRKLTRCHDLIERLEINCVSDRKRL
ncbi:MAG: hypothetical protein ACP5HK_07480, partial [Acidilobus sp.]